MTTNNQIVVNPLDPFTTNPTVSQNDQLINSLFDPSAASSVTVQDPPSQDPTSSADQTSLASIGSDKTLILNNIYALLSIFVETLQQTASDQADRLQIYTQWQNAYTKQISTIPTFTAGDGSWPGTRTYTQQQGLQFRADCNTLSNSYIEQNTAQNDVISSEAQTQQSALNASTDAVTQQSQFASSIIDTLSNLLYAIFQ